VSLRRKIEQEIHEHGPLPFSAYMAMCLYDPELGYYSRNAQQFGKAGDFYTSSDVHAVFGRLLARQFEEMWRALRSPRHIDLVELGPGRGLFAQDVMDWSNKKFPAFADALHYRLVEGSPALRASLESRFAEQITAGKVNVSGAPGDAPFENSILFANELFDALPVEIVSPSGQLHVIVKEGKFAETFLPPSAEITDYLDRYSVHPEPGERVDVPLEAFRAMNRLTAALKSGFLVVVDYGYTRAEQLEGRHRDTLMTYRQHSACVNPYEAPGEQDVTSHVNFTALAVAAERNGLQTYPLLTQSQFLLGIGEANQFADAFEDCVMPQEHAKVALQLKHLVTPAGMGESFHVLLASKNVDASAAEALAGLSFSKSRL
jgi:SAM-dependent MidA family methyltransferase